MNFIRSRSRVINVVIYVLMIVLLLVFGFIERLRAVALVSLEETTNYRHDMRHHFMILGGIYEER